MIQTLSMRIPKLQPQSQDTLHQLRRTARPRMLSQLLAQALPRFKCAAL